MKHRTEIVALLGLIMTCLFSAPVAAQTAASNLLPATNEERIAELVTANHILAAEGVLDGFGHVSVRSATNTKHYFMARSRAAALVTRDDIVEFDENSQPIDARGRELYSERFIHGEIYRARPDVQSVVHSHSPAVLPFGVTNVPLKALIHVAYFLGDQPVPVYEIRDSEGPENEMLVNNAHSGAALAHVLGTRAVALMRGHGMAVVGPSIEDAVFRAIYTQENAQVEIEALRLGTPKFLNRFEAGRSEKIRRQWELWVRDADGAHK